MNHHQSALLLAGSGKLAPDVVELVAAYEQIKTDLRLDFVKLAQSIAEINPIPAPFLIHLVRKDDDLVEPEPRMPVLSLVKNDSSAAIGQEVCGQ